MPSERELESLKVDRADLIGLLELRFGSVTPEVREQIEAINNRDTLERLILVAANVPQWEGFVTELKEGKNAFRIVGDQYNPISQTDQRTQ